MSGDVWYAVSLSNGISAGRSAGTQLFDKEIVLWRDVDGVPHAWEDRCPHRGMRLSFGFVRNDRLACLYHGWQYDAEGKCRFIPAHPELDVPATIRVTTYPCRERLGMVWMRSSSAAKSSPEPVIDQHMVTPVRSVHIDCPFDTVIETLATRGNFVGEGIALISTSVDQLKLLIAVQPYSQRKTALHIVIEDSDDRLKGDAQSAAATWAEHIRLELERPSAIAAEFV
jgi:nitrite reductase/ring-hydroxylating ferredoxin subunit